MLGFEFIFLLLIYMNEIFEIVCLYKYEVCTMDNLISCNITTIISQYIEYPIRNFYIIETDFIILNAQLNDLDAGSGVFQKS